MPDPCAPSFSKDGVFSMVCIDKTWFGLDLNQFNCYLPKDIEPILERCTK